MRAGYLELEWLALDIKALHLYGCVPIHHCLGTKQDPAQSKAPELDGTQEAGRTIEK